MSHSLFIIQLAHEVSCRLHTTPDAPVLTHLCTPQLRQSVVVVHSKLKCINEQMTWPSLMLALSSRRCCEFHISHSWICSHYLGLSGKKTSQVLVYNLICFGDFTVQHWMQQRWWIGRVLWSKHEMEEKTQTSGTVFCNGVNPQRQPSTHLKRAVTDMKTFMTTKGVLTRLKTEHLLYSLGYF